MRTAEQPRPALMQQRRKVLLKKVACNLAINVSRSGNRD
jgi:hypothetical protein